MGEVSVQWHLFLGYNAVSQLWRGWLFGSNGHEKALRWEDRLAFGDLVEVALQESGDADLAARAISILVNSGAIYLRRRVISCK